jgi:hypothetical protein
MDPTTLFIVGVIGAVALIALLVPYIVATRRKHPPTELPPATKAMIADARIDPGERVASTAAEQIEERVKQKLAQYPDLAGTKIDFGSVPDLTVDIWVNDVQYDDVDDIPDERIRRAIQEAAASF